MPTTVGHQVGQVTVRNCLHFSLTLQVTPNPQGLNHTAAFFPWITLPLVTLTHVMADLFP